MGLQGPQGATGPPGLSQYQRREVSCTTGAGDWVAVCVAPRKVLGGGYIHGTGLVPIIDRDYPSNTFTWHVSLASGNTFTPGAKVYALCAVAN